MKKTTIGSLLLLFLCLGCTTLSQIELSPQELRAQIRTGDLIQTNDFIIVTTQDGQKHELSVRSITDTHIIGNSDQALISEIVTVERRKISTGKTATNVGLIYLGAFALAYAIVCTSVIKEAC